jgi:hypothetical protein
MIQTSVTRQFQEADGHTDRQIDRLTDCLIAVGLACQATR